MPHQIDTLPVKASPFFGVTFSTEEVNKAAGGRIEVWGSSFNDPGDDWNEFRLIAADGNPVTTHRISGY